MHCFVLNFGHPKRTADAMRHPSRTSVRAYIPIPSILIPITLQAREFRLVIGQRTDRDDRTITVMDYISLHHHRPLQRDRILHCVACRSYCQGLVW